MTIATSLRRIGLAFGVLLLVAACAGTESTQARFEAECQAAGIDAGSERFAACVEERWSRYRPSTRGRGGGR
ncbi:MAG: hypothetical protein QNJ67_21395 [Kiloniellales bacterium]|nr:hypothetical protein [Kiloniellales bacterium]